VRYVTSVERFSLEERYRQGVQEGEALLLIRFLEKRFGPVSDGQRKRILAADSQTIEAWADQVLTASSLDSVLASESIH